MLKLNLKTDPYWIDLPSNIRVKVKPLSTAIMAAAHIMAKTAYQQLVDNGETDQANDALRTGTSNSLLFKSLAQLSIIEWEDVVSADSGDLLPVNDQTVSALMDFWLVAQQFFNKYTAQFAQLETEGNVSAPAANGTSAAAAPIAGSAA